MEVLGHGFVAKNLAPIADGHPDVVAFARGVSSTSCVDESEFAREADALYAAVSRCRADGRLLLFFSSASASMYGHPHSTGREDGPVFPPTPYGRHKLALEGVLAAAGIRTLVLRLSHLVGPHQGPHQILTSLVSQVLAGTVRIHRGARRDLLDVRDMGTLADALLRRGVHDTVVNVASGDAVPVEALVDEIELRLGVTPRREWIDVPALTKPVSIDRLRALAPETAGVGFGPSYLRRLVTTYVPAAAAAGSLP